MPKRHADFLVKLCPPKDDFFRGGVFSNLVEAKRLLAQSAPTLKSRLGYGKQKNTATSNEFTVFLAQKAGLAPLAVRPA